MPRRFGEFKNLKPSQAQTLQNMLAESSDGHSRECYASARNLSAIGEISNALLA